MTIEQLDALGCDATDLASTLHLLADAMERRGDADSFGALRLLARHAERIVEQLEAIAESTSAQERP